MSVSSYSLHRTSSVRQQLWRQRRVWLFGYASVFLVGLMVAGMAWKRSYQQEFGVALGMLVVTMAAWMIRPRLGLHLTMFLALIGDTVTVSWFPFNKNLSSHESILFVGDGLTVSPLEIVLVVGLIVVVLRNVSATRRALRHGTLFWPLMAFVGFVAFGFVRGIGSGGDVRVAIFEMRPLLYIPLMYLLVTNVCEERKDYRHLLWTAMAAVFLQSLLSLRYMNTLTPEVRDNMESLTEHGSSIGMNVFFMLLFAALTYRGISRAVRLLMVLCSMPIAWVYLESQRRAAVIGLGLCLLLFFAVLFWRQRRTFWKVAPIAIILVVGYLGAFWNSTSNAGFPAQAAKTVIAPDSLSAKDQSSDLYRKIENYDLSVTIRSSPVFGLGFGQRFLRPVPLADISVFEFYEYIPHNSTLWIWIKLGFGGFALVFFLFGRAVMLGAARLRRLRDPVDALAMTGALMFVVSFAIYTYVDIAYDPRNSVLLGFAFAMCADFMMPRPQAPAAAESPAASRRPEDHAMAGVR
jgi:hypothetical protein